MAGVIAHTERTLIKSLISDAGAPAEVEQAIGIVDVIDLNGHVLGGSVTLHDRLNFDRPGSAAELTGRSIVYAPPHRRQSILYARAPILPACNDDRSARVLNFRRVVADAFRGHTARGTS
jgi:hypothetical protein